MGLVGYLMLAHVIYPYSKNIRPIPQAALLYDFKSSPKRSRHGNHIAEPIKKVDQFQQNKVIEDLTKRIEAIEQWLDLHK